MEIPIYKCVLELNRYTFLFLHNFKPFKISIERDTPEWKKVVYIESGPTKIIAEETACRGSGEYTLEVKRIEFNPDSIPI